MLIKRAVLLEAAEKAKPGLADKDLVEELLFFWFDGETLTAYNDKTVGIQVPLKTEFTGGLRGVILLGLLNNSLGEVKIEPKKGDVVIEIGKTKLKMPLLEIEKAPHELPDISKAKAVKLTAAFYEGLKAVMVSVSGTANVPDQMGVTIINQAALQLYTTDAKTISWATVKDVKGWPIKPGERVILPIPFVQQLIILGDESTRLYLTQDDVLAETGDGVKLFARLIESGKPVDFHGTVTEALASVQLVTIPKRLKLMLERADVMLMGQQEQVIDMATDGATLHFHTRTFYGDLKDDAKLDEMPKNVELRANPGLLKRALPLCDMFGMSADSVIMKGVDANFIYLVANYGAE